MPDLNKIGMDFMKNQRWNEAIPCFQKSLSQDPRQSGTWYMLGQCHRFCNEIDKSIEALENATSLNDKEAGFFLALGISYQLAERFDESLQSLKTATKLDPHYDTAYNSIGLTYRKMGDCRNALSYYDFAIQNYLVKCSRTLKSSYSEKVIKFFDIGEITKRFLDLALNDHLKIHKLTVADAKHPGINWQNDNPENIGGYYWLDPEQLTGVTTSESSEHKRFYTPNFFNTLKLHLASDVFYWNTLKNMSTAFQQLGNEEDEKKHWDEAIVYEEYYKKLIDLGIEAAVVLDPKEENYF